MLSSFEVPEEDKEWLTAQAKEEIGSVNSVLRKIIKEARLRDERKKAK
jgi:hypothetical protein